MITRRNFTRLSLFGLGIGLANCTSRSQSPNPSTNPRSDRADLIIWWEQGFLPEENELLVQIVRDWEEQSGAKVDLKLLPVYAINRQLDMLMEESGNPEMPDIVYSVGVDTSLAVLRNL